MTYRIVVLGGLGDAYLLAALFDGFRRHYGDAVLVVKGRYAPLFDLFGVPYVVDDRITFGAEGEKNLQRDHDNVLEPGREFFAHPCMRRTQVKLDELPARAFVTQADMYRLILQLPLDSPIAQPRVPDGEPELDTVMMVHATTWPNTQPEFPAKLGFALGAAGRKVWVNDGALPLADLLARAARTEWVIGPQCGLMSILVAGEWPCRKTLATPSIDDGAGGDYWAKSTFPYAYVSRFMGRDYDVEEIKIDDDHDRALVAILNGPNAFRLRQHDPRPVTSIPFALSPGDLLDRLAVLAVKKSRFSGDGRALIQREYDRHAEAARPLLERSDGWGYRYFADLFAEHAKAFDVLERAVPSALAGSGLAAEDHAAVIAMNRERVRLKQAVDAAFGAAYSEVKSYYGSES